MFVMSLWRVRKVLFWVLCWDFWEGIPVIIVFMMILYSVIVDTFINKYKAQ